MSELILLRDDLDKAIEKASATMEMLYQFLRNKDEIKELSFRGADFIMEDTQEELEFIKSKFHLYIKEKLKNDNNSSTN